MTSDTFITWSGWVISGFVAGLAAFDRFRGIKRAGNKELVESLTIDRNAWKSASEAAHSELKTYRDETHKRLDESNQKQLALTSENARLHAATDISPVLLFQKEQSIINAQVIAQLTKQATAIDMVLAHLTTLGPCINYKPSINRKGTKKQPPHHAAD